MTDLAYAVYVAGERVYDGTDPAHATRTAQKAKLADPDSSVVIVVAEPEEVTLTCDQYAMRPFAVSPGRQASNVVELRPLPFERAAAIRDDEHTVA